MSAVLRNLNPWLILGVVLIIIGGFAMSTTADDLAHLVCDWSFCDRAAFRDSAAPIFPHAVLASGLFSFGFGIYRLRDALMLERTMDDSPDRPPYSSSF